MFEVGKTYSVATKEGAMVTAERLSVLEVNFPLVKFDRPKQKPIILNTAAFTFVSAEEISGGEVEELDADFLALIPGHQAGR